MKQSKPNPNCRVLVVDDNVQLLRVIRLRLELDCFEVVISETGDKALTMLEAGLRPDIVLTDAVMPGDAQGLDLARYCRRHYPKLPVVLMSGYLDASDRQVSGAPEINCFLPKPLILSNLSAVVSSLTCNSLKDEALNIV